MPVLLSIEGLEKSGKSTLAYTAPTPIVGFSFDMGSLRAINGSAFDKFFKGLKVKISKDYGESYKGYDIFIYEVPIPIQLTETVTGCKELWNKFQAKYAEAGLDTSIKSLVFDTATLIRKLKVEAYLQELNESGQRRKQLLQIEYGHPNDAIRTLWNFGQQSGKNVIGTHHLTDEYKIQTTADGKKESQPTGDLVLEGYNKTHQAVDVAVRLESDKKETKALIMTCGYDREMVGMSVTEPSWDKIVNMIELRLGGRVTLDKRG